VNPYSTATVIKCKNPPAFIDPITQLINQVTSMDLEISKVALSKLNKMLMIPEVSIMFNILMYIFVFDFPCIYLLQTRSKFLEDGKVLSLFHGIIRQFDILLENNDPVKYKNIFNLCLNVSTTKGDVIPARVVSALLIFIIPNFHSEKNILCC